MTAVHRMIQLVGQCQTGPELDALIDDSCEDPESFSSELLQHVAAVTDVAPEGLLGDGYDLYHDLVVRWLDRNGTALTAYDLRGRVHQMGYRDLHDRVGRLMTAWTQSGVVAGDVVAILLPVGIGYAVGLLTALRMGLIVGPCPPRGKSFIRRRIETLQPTWVVHGEGYGDWVPEGVGQYLSVSTAQLPSETEGLRSHSYNPTDPVFMTFSPFAEDSSIPVPITAQSSHRKIVRDATIVFRLAPGNRVGAPGWDVLQMQPGLLMATLFGGGTFVEVSPDQMMEVSDTEWKFDRLGVTAEFRDAMRAGRVIVETKEWFKDPSEPYHWESWRKFSEAMAKKKHRGFNLLYSSAFGGVLLFSPPQDNPQLEVFPGPGQSWSLVEMGTYGHLSRSGAGLYAPEGDDVVEGAFGRYMIAQVDQGFFFAGAIDPDIRGQIYPKEEVVEVLTEVDGVTGISVNHDRAVGVLNASVRVLLVFLDPLREDLQSSAVRGQLTERLDREMGAFYRPSITELYVLAPKQRDGKIDHDWCRWQYASGVLDAKNRRPIFKLLAQIRRIAERVEEERASA